MLLWLHVPVADLMCGFLGAAFQCEPFRVRLRMAAVSHIMLQYVHGISFLSECVTVASVPRHIPLVNGKAEILRVCA